MPDACTRIRARGIFSGFLAAALCAAAIPAEAQGDDEACAFQRAYSVDGGQVTRQGDNLIIEVWGHTAGDGWTNPRLALVPEDTNAVAVEYRLIGCVPPEDKSTSLHPMRARAVVIAMPGRIRSIVVQAATNDLRLQDTTQ